MPGQEMIMVSFIRQMNIVVTNENNFAYSPPPSIIQLLYTSGYNTETESTVAKITTTSWKGCIDKHFT